MVEALDLEVLGVREVTALVDAISFELPRADVVIRVSFLMVRLRRLEHMRFRRNTLVVDDECLVVERPRVLPTLFEGEVLVHEVF